MGAVNERRKITTRIRTFVIFEIEQKLLQALVGFILNIERTHRPPMQPHVSEDRRLKLVMNQRVHLANVSPRMQIDLGISQQILLADSLDEVFPLMEKVQIARLNTAGGALRQNVQFDWR